VSFDWVGLLKSLLQTPSPMTGAPSIGGTCSVPISSTGYNREVDEAAVRARIVAFMLSQLGKPYKLGVEITPGKEAWASEWDCSELVEAAYRLARHVMPDGARFQFAATQPIRSPKPGDLFFLWSDKLNYIGHVMAATGRGTVVHAVGGRGVVEDPMSMWEYHARGRGWRRHVDFARPREDMA